MMFTVTVLIILILGIVKSAKFLIKSKSNKLKSSISRLDLSIKSIIRWEQLNNKPYLSLNYENEDDILSLFYCISITDEINQSFKEFKASLDKESSNMMIKDFERTMVLMSQFQEKGNKEPTIEQQEESEPIYIGELVSTLIMNGLDANFALTEMSLCDLSLYVDAYDRKIKSNLEFKRLCVYLLLSPHLTKKIKSPKDIFPFSWELDDKDQETESDKEESLEIFNSVLKNGLN